MRALEPWHLLVLLIVILVLFGGKRLPDAARGLGRSMRIFKSEIGALNDDSKPARPADPPATEALEGRVVDDDSQPKASSTEPRRDS